MPLPWFVQPRARNCCYKAYARLFWSYWTARWRWYPRLRFNRLLAGVGQLSKLFAISLCPKPDQGEADNRGKYPRQPRETIRHRANQRAKTKV